MSELQALIFTFIRGMIALAGTVALIELLGGGFELTALAIVVFMCVIPWQTAGVVMRYADRDRGR
jgi:hypothetical protein